MLRNICGVRRYGRREGSEVNETVEERRSRQAPYYRRTEIGVLKAYDLIERVENAKDLKSVYVGVRLRWRVRAG